MLGGVQGGYVERQVVVRPPWHVLVTVVGIVRRRRPLRMLQHGAALTPWPAIPPTGSPAFGPVFGSHKRATRPMGRADASRLPEPAGCSIHTHTPLGSALPAPARNYVNQTGAGCALHAATRPAATKTTLTIEYLLGYIIIITSLRQRQLFQLNQTSFY